MTQPPPPDTQAPHEIALDITCVSCGYNLRGLSSDGRCPECGTAIERSLHGDFLRFADPAYVRRLASGVTTILWVIPMTFVGYVVGQGVNAITQSEFPAHIIDWAVVLLGFAGGWMVTTPDPGKPDTRRFSARGITRFGLLLAMLAYVLDYLTLFADGRVPDGAADALSILALVTGLASLVGLFAKLVYFRSLALRIPDLGLAWRARAVIGGLSVCLVMVVFGGASALLAAIDAAPRSTYPRGARHVSIAELGCALAVLFAIWWLVVLFGYRRRFIDQAMLAANTWQAQPAARS